MIKALFLLLFLTFFSLGALWFVENDGSIVIDWMGYRIQTSVAFAILSVIITIVICTLFAQIFLWVKSAPKRYRKAMKEKRLSRGLTALTQGFAAIAAGDTKQAKLLTSKASNNLDNMPLTKLLAAQTAQLEGNHELAKEHFSSMMQNKETEIIAIKGLLLESKHENDLNKALFLAEKAYNLRPDADWVIQILFDLYRSLHKWEKAEEITRKALKKKLIPTEYAAHNFGIIALAQHISAIKKGREDEGEKYIKTAYKYLPNFVPVITAFAKMLIKKDKIKKASSLLESAWEKAPHPDIANLYMENFIHETDEKRIARAEKLLNLSNGHPEGHIILARTLLTSGQFSKARSHLKAALSHGDTKASCHLMAELETIERASFETINYWQERAIMADNLSIWKCGNCGTKHDSWHITCPHCHSFDSLKWQDIKPGVGNVQAKLLV